MHRVVKEIEIDYGHTLPKHLGFCNQIHGHRARIQVCIAGHLQRNEGVPDQGMVIDFGKVKEIMMKKIHRVLDHGFAVWKDDTTVVTVHDWSDVPLASGDTKFIDVKVSTLAFIKARNQKVLVTDLPPTAEVLAEWAFEQVNFEIQTLVAGFEIHNVVVEWVRWWETPNSYAQYPLEQPKLPDYLE